MPGGHEGRGGTQVRFSDNMDWWCARPQPRTDLETIPFVGIVGGEQWRDTRCYAPEVRRRDVGKQRYGAGIPTQNSTIVDRHGLLVQKSRAETTHAHTSEGLVSLCSCDEKLGCMPTADAINFLRSEYQGSRAPKPPTRYFPLPWR